MLIVLGGTRKAEKIPLEVIDLLQYYVSKKSEFLVGDAPGIDTAFQKELKKLHVAEVTVCSSAESVRNNIGSWPEKIIESGLISKSHAQHSAKDRYMTIEADLGIMVWDAQSAGTLANVLDLVSMGKECFLFNFLDSELIRFDSQLSLDRYLKVHSDVRSEAERRNSAYNKRQKKMKRIEKKESELQLFQD